MVDPVREQHRRLSKRAVGKFILLVCFVMGGFALVRYTPMSLFISPEGLDRLLQGAGFWAPGIFMLFEAAAICLFVPASILIVLGAVLFGPFKGFLFGWIGALAGASGAFLIGRTLGRELIVSLLGTRTRRYDDAVARNGFTTVLYLRLLNSPFTPMNYGFSLTKVHFWDYFFGTGLGIVVSMFVITFLSGTLKTIWKTGRWEALFSLEVALAMALYLFSFFIPVIVRRIKTGIAESS